MIATTAALAAYGQDFTQFTAPRGSGDLDQLADVSIGPDGRMWVVGNTGSASELRGLARWWDGAAWQPLPVPDLALAFDRVTAVVATDAAEAWAVGYSANQSFSQSRSRPFALRWKADGTVDRELFATARPDERLYGVAAGGPDDVWTVGEAFGISAGEPLVHHWDGAAWSRIGVPHPYRYARLHDVGVLAADDAWAVGAKFVRGNDHAYALRWDGVAWTEVTVPAETIYQDTLLAVDASGPDDAWAVGSHLQVFGVSQVQQTTAVHWDGAAWTVVPTPDPSQGNNRLYDVVALAPDDAWAVGTWDDGTALRTLVMHWDGAAWTQVPSEDPGVWSNELTGVAVGVDGPFAVGQWSDGLVTVDGLVLH